MSEPPSYEESASEYGRRFDDQKVDDKSAGSLQHFNIRAEVGASRSQHVAALVAKILPQIHSRARRGLSRSTLLLLPSDQGFIRKGQVVGFTRDDNPVLFQLEGDHDSLEFWTQQEALNDLQGQLVVSLSDVGLLRTTVRLPERPVPPASKSSWLHRKTGKAPAIEISPTAGHISVELEEINFRTENDFGLYETLRGRAVVVIVESG